MNPAMEEIGICPCCDQHVIERQKGNTYDTTVVMTVDENQRAVFELNFEKGEAKHGKGNGKKN